MARPILYVILDGVGDLPFPKRGNRTPLEAAKTPYLDQLAAKGRMGLVYTVKRGIAPESDAGVFSLLSYDPTKLTLSRGVVEALGAGLEFKDGDLALRANFATVQNGKLVDRRAGRNVSNLEAKQIAQAINESSKLKSIAEFELKHTTGHRCALVIRNGGKFSDAVSNLDPAYVRKGRVGTAVPVKLPTAIPKCKPLKLTKTAVRTAKVLNELATGILKVLDEHPVNVARRARGDLPANYLLMRDAGTKIPKLRTLKEKFGIRSVALVDMPVEIGITKTVGMDMEAFPAERTVEAYAQRARRALELAEHYDLVYVHLKGPDEPGHDGDFDGKRKSVEDIDQGFFSGIQKLEHRLLCVTADHSTPCTIEGHSDDPVPLLVTGLNIKPDGTMRFTEKYGRAGKIGKLAHGYGILRMLRNLAERS